MLWLVFPYIKSCSSDINGQIAHWQDALKALISLNKEHQQEVEATKKRRVTTVKLIRKLSAKQKRSKTDCTGAVTPLDRGKGKGLDTLCAYPLNFKIMPR